MWFQELAPRQDTRPLRRVFVISNGVTYSQEHADEYSDLASDLLWGVAAVAAELGRRARATFHLLSSGLPGARIGGRWVASRAKLRRHIEALLKDAAA